MASGGVSTAHAGAGGPRAAPPVPSTEFVQQKRDLRSWWKTLTSDKKPPEQQHPAASEGIFGVPLERSIRYANVAISLYNDNNESYIYGYVPIVVAKCGVFLKEKATDVEGIFRLAGSEKRIKELKAAFDSPDRYGKGLDWTGYTVHDAANILRRYFNMLPEPIIPLDFYQRFREPLRNHQAQAVGAMEAQSPSVGDFDNEAAIKVYQGLITELPPLNRQLLLYILDLLAVFASKSDLNKMTTMNLAAIFQPGILSHPQHDMAPQEYRLSQDVLIFLIENQDSFLIGMQGTAADADTVRDVQSGTPARQPTTPTTPSRSKAALGRSSSTASAGAESVRQYGNIRRNVSVSSRQSKRSEGPTAVTPSIASPGTPTSGVHRSNTVPSRRAGSAAHSPRFSRDKTSDPSTPSPGTVSNVDTTELPRHESVQSTPVASAAPALPPMQSNVQPPEVISASSSEATTPMGGLYSDTTSTLRSEYATPKKETTPLLSPRGAGADLHAERTPSNTPSTASSGGFLGIFKQSPTSDSEGRRPNKLQKKRIPGSALSSAASSNQSLHNEGQAHEATLQSPQTPGFPPSHSAPVEKADEHSNYTTAQTTPVQVQAGPQRTATDATLRPTTSPTHSSHSTDFSDADLVGDDMPHNSQELPGKEKKRRRWRFSRSQNNLEQPQTPKGSGNQLGSMTREQATSQSTMSSHGGQPRRSFQEPTPLAHSTTDPTAGTPMQPPQLPPSSTEPVFSDSEREKKGGPMSWIRGKIQDRRDKEAEKRVKSPERDQGRHESKLDARSPSEATHARGKSLEQQRIPSSVQQADQRTPNAATPEHGAAQAIAARVMATPVTASAPADMEPGTAGGSLAPNGHQTTQ